MCLVLSCDFSKRRGPKTLKRPSRKVRPPPNPRPVQLPTEEAEGLVGHQAAAKGAAKAEARKAEEKKAPTELSLIAAIAASPS